MNDPYNPYGGGQPQHPHGGHPQQPQGQWGQPQQQPQGQWGQPQHPQMQQQGQWGQAQHPGFAQQAAFGGVDPHAHQQQVGLDDSQVVAAHASPQARAKFIERTYLHLAGAIILFVLLSAGVQYVPGVENLSIMMLESWMIVLLAFMGVSWVADRWARSSTSLPMQYFGLIVYTVAEVVVFIPLIAIALSIPDFGAQGIMTAAVTTLAIFAGLTGYVFITKKDFSFMRGMLSVLAMGAVGLVFGSLLFGFQLGLLFSVGMVVLAGGYILYYTSNVLHHYRTTQHVAAALALFSAVALLFWYILRIFMRR